MLKSLPTGELEHLAQVLCDPGAHSWAQGLLWDSQSRRTLNLIVSGWPC